jgi:hypothetical protein
MAQWNPYSQNKTSEFFDPYWMFGIKDGFDVVIGNPPYLKEGRVLKSVFDGLHGTKYYQGKLDLWYIFACIGIDLLVNNGNLCFIATNNWTTNAGASKLRNKIIMETRILHLIDFNTYMVFESAGIQTMIMQFKKDNISDGYTFDYRKLKNGDSNSDVISLFNLVSNDNSEYMHPIITRDKFQDSYIVFNEHEYLFEKISLNKTCLFSNEVAQGVVFPQDTLNAKNRNILGGSHNTGEGIFCLTKQELDSLSLNKDEYRLVKPFFSTEQIHNYLTTSNNKLWIIYTDSSYKNKSSMNKYPNLKKHLDQYKKIFTSDNKPYGLHRSREENNFKGEKILALRKSVLRPLFSYSDFDSYVSQTFNIIKTNRVNIKYLLGLLNSSLIRFWLKYKGKMQGDNYQLDMDPLTQIPICIPDIHNQNKIIDAVDKILKQKKSNLHYDSIFLEKEIDQLVYKLYNLTAEEIAIVEGKNG